MDVLRISLGFHPNNMISLDEEIRELLAEPYIWRESRAIAEEFVRNGITCDFCPNEYRNSQEFAVRRNTHGVIGRPPSPWCVFCRRNGETATFCKSHAIKDKFGKVTCPILRTYCCPTCGASGDNAHTIKYCPKNKNRNAIPTVILLKSARSSTGTKSKKARQRSSSSL